jgi:hypothetical protein
MDMRHAEKDVEIAVGVMSALAVLLAAVEAWSWARRYVHPKEEGRAASKVLIKNLTIFSLCPSKQFLLVSFKIQLLIADKLVTTQI